MVCPRDCHGVSYRRPYMVCPIDGHMVCPIDGHMQQARSQGGGGRGVVRPPPVAHPKDFVPPFSNFVPPFSNFVPPFSNFVPPFSNFVPPFSNFVPPLEYVDDVTRAMSKGGVRLVFHPSKFRPPHLAGWLRACVVSYLWRAGHR